MQCWIKHIIQVWYPKLENCAPHLLNVGRILFWIEAAFHFRSHVQWQSCRARSPIIGLPRGRERLSEQLPFSPLSTSLSPAISRSASSRRIRQPSHFGNEGARLAICECVCFRSIPPAAYLTCKGRKNGKGSERFCTVSLFYGMFPVPLPSSPICYAGSSITPPQ